MRDTTRPIKNQDCYSKKVSFYLGFRCALRTPGTSGKARRKDLRKEGSTHVISRRAAPRSRFLRFVRFARLGFRPSRRARRRADDRARHAVRRPPRCRSRRPPPTTSQTNFDSWTAAAQNIAKQLATAEKTTTTAITAKPAPASRPRIGSATTPPTSRRPSTTPFPPKAGRRCSHSSPTWKASAYQQGQGGAIAGKIDALNADLTATAQTLDGNANLADPKTYAKQRAEQTAAERKKLDAAKRTPPKAKATARGAKSPAK